MSIYAHIYIVIRIYMWNIPRSFSPLPPPSYYYSTHFMYTNNKAKQKSIRIISAKRMALTLCHHRRVQMNVKDVECACIVEMWCVLNFRIIRSFLLFSLLIFVHDSSLFFPASHRTDSRICATHDMCECALCACVYVWRRMCARPIRVKFSLLSHA